MGSGAGRGRRAPARTAGRRSAHAPPGAIGQLVDPLAPFAGGPIAALALGLIAAFAASAPLAGQATDPVRAPADPGDPAWTTRWSPLAQLGDLPRRLPGGEAVFPSLLVLPAPRVGLFWTAGNPAALPDEAADTWVGFRAERADVSGEYRRPLDPHTEVRTRLRGLGWRPLGARGAAIGRVVVDRQSLEEAVHSDVLVPYTSNPFVVLDTLGDGMNRTAARLEGAGGWRLGPVGVGLGLGYEAHETRTKVSAVPRTNRTAVPGVTGGVTLALSDALRLGAAGRWRQATHNLTVFSIGAPSRVFAPTGYEEPVAFNLSAIAFQRRLQRTAWAAGLALAGETGGVSWVAYGQRESLGEDRFNPGSNDPLVDAWEARGWTAGAAARLALGEPWLLTLDARYTTLDGEAVRGDVELLNFTADESRLEAGAELRLLPAAGWEAAIAGRVVRESRLRRDRLQPTFSDIESWEPAAAAEVARHLSGRFALALGGAFSAYAPNSTTPDPAEIGPAYAEWIAPELGLHATDATAWAGTATARLRVGAGTHAWLRGRYGAVSAGTADPPLPDSPTGDRDGWTLTLGATLGGP